MTNAFVTELNPAGSALVYSTYLGGTGAMSVYGDVVHAIAVDGSGNAYIAGEAYSTNFPITTGAYQTINKGAANHVSNAFLTKLNATGTALVFSTYLGGSGNITLGDYALSVSMDSSGNVYLAGNTYSSNFPTTAGAFQTTNNAAANNNDNAFVAKLNADASQLIYATYLGGNGFAEYGDKANALVVDNVGDAYVAGEAYSINFPVTEGAYQTTQNAVANGAPNAFITKLNPAGSALVYSTYLGGSDGEQAAALGVDGEGNTYITGKTYSPNFPVTTDAYQTTDPCTKDASPFVTELNAAGNGLIYSAFFGGSSGDYAYGLATDGLGNVYITGQVYSKNFPLSTGAYQTTNRAYNNVGTNVFVAKLSLGQTQITEPTTTILSASVNPQQLGLTVTFTAFVQPVSGTGIPTGTVTFSVDGGVGTAITLDDTGHASYATSNLAAGAHTIKASYSGDSNDSPSSATLTETIINAAAPPIFSPAAGVYTSATSVTITDATPGATIYYTTNGTTPTSSSTKYTAAITVSATETIEAIAVASGYANSAVASATYTIQHSTASGLQFVAVTPCRIADTRNATGPFGGPELAGGSTRTFDIPQSACSIPSTAIAYSLNATVVPDAALGYLTVFPAGEAQPLVSTLNSDGRVKANATITPAGTSGGVSVYASDPTQFILDIDGYFVPAGTNASGLEFYPLTPCRIADTRNATGPLGGPSLTGGVGRAFPIQSSACGIPSTAKAYSLNVTAVPHGGLGYLTSWPTGETQPVVSTLNATTGAVTANAAIVPAGTSGEVSIYVSNDADVVLDVDGYFAAPGTGGLSLYTVTPCRVIDTRNGAGAFDGVLTVPVETSVCAAPPAAQAYVLNATVVPPGDLGYLSLWAAGTTQPVVSTLNASDGAITSNMAIVPTINGSVDAFSSNPTQLILDLSSYFAP